MRRFRSLDHSCKKHIGQTLLALGLSLLLVACGETTAPADGAAASSGKVYRWKLITTWPPGLRGLGTAPVTLAQRIDEMSGGRLKIKVYGAGELVGAFETFDAVSQGTAEMGHGAAYYWRGKAPVAAVFASVPFGMNAEEMRGWLHFGGGLELWRELYEPFNLVPFTGGNTGVQMAGWFNKEINSVADLQGLKMRIPGLGGEVLRRAGGSPVALPGNEVFTSLQTGVIDATEWVSPYNDLALGLHKAAKYYYYPGWQEPGPELETLVNKDAWDSLPADLQAIVRTATLAMDAEVPAEFTARNAIALDTLVNEHGVKVLPLPDDVLRRLQELSQEVLDELAASDPLAQRIVKSYRDFSASVIRYGRISEQAYSRARDLGGAGQSTRVQSAQ